MSEEDPKRNSHWMEWTLGLLAVPVVYLLTEPPVVYAFVYDRKAGSFKTAPAWLGWYTAPGDWLYEQVPVLRKPLGAYADWWLRMYSGKSAP